MKVRAALEVTLAGTLLLAGAQFDPVTHAARNGLQAAVLVTVNGSASATEPAVRLQPPGPTLAGCPMYPSDNAWNTTIRDAPLLANSTAMVNYIQARGGDNLHPDFGENPAYGIPYVVVPANQSLVKISYDD